MAEYPGLPDIPNDKTKLELFVIANTKHFVNGMKIVAAAAAAGFAAAVKVSAEFEKSLSKLRAISGANVKQMKTLEKQSRSLGKSTAFTATEVAGLQIELAKLGFTTNEILNASGGVLDLAAGLGVTLADAASLVGTEIRAFGLEAEDTGRVVDVLALAASSSALDFSGLTEGLKDAAPIAKLYNFTIEETVAMLGQLANAGIKGSKAGTSLRQIFLELDKKGIKLADALQMVRDSANPAATAMDLVKKRAAGAFAILANGNKDVEELAKQLENAQGSAEKMRLTMEDNLQGDWDKFVSATTDLGISLGNSTNPELRKMLQWLTDIAGVISDDIDFEDFRRKIAAFTGSDGSIKKYGKTFEDVIKNSLTDKGKEAIDELISVKKRYDKFFIKDLIGPQIDSEDFINAQTQSDMIKYWNSLGANITAVDLDTDNFAKTYKKLLTIISSGNLADLGDSGHSSTGGGGGNTVGGNNAGGDRATSKPVLEIEPVLSTTYEQAAEWRKHARKIVEAFGEAWNIETKSLGNIIAPSAIEINKALTASIVVPAQEVTKKANEVGDALKAAAASAFSGLGTAIGEALAGSDDIGQKFLSIIGTFMVQFGSALVALGIAEAAWIASLEPTTKIIAGAALVIAGAAISSTAKDKPGAVSGGGGAPRSPIPSSASVTPSLLQGVGTGGQLVATVRGQDLRFVLQGANDNYTALN